MSDSYNYNFYKILTQRSIDIIDTKSLLTYGMIGITAVVLAVATLYDEIEEENNTNEEESSLFGKSETTEDENLSIFGKSETNGGKSETNGGKSETNGGKRKKKHRKTKRNNSKK
jgi:hypothetical protein